MLQEENNQAELVRKKTDRLHDFVTELVELKEKQGKKKIAAGGDFGTLENLDSTVYSLRGLVAQAKKVGHVAEMLKNFSGAVKAL